LVKPRDEALRDVRRVVAGAEGVRPLLVRQLAEQAARPSDVVDRDAIAKKFLMPAVIAELYVASADARDELLVREEFGIAALGIEPARLAERSADIADDIPPRGAFARLLQLVKRVVRVLQIGAVEHHQDDEQAAIRRSVGEWILLPRPLAAILQRFVVR